jgi:glycosyltransferase involved in cell wall biosynthesis
MIEKQRQQAATSYHSSPYSVCHLTSQHKALDTRVFDRQAVSLAKAGYDVTIIGKHQQAETVNGVKIVPLKQSSRYFTRSTIGIWRLLKAAVKQRCQLYHFHDPELIFVGLALKLLGKKVIYDVHEDYEQNILSRQWLRKWPRIKMLIAKLTYLTEVVASHFFDWIVAADSNIKSKFPNQKSTVIMNVPPRSFIRDNQRDGLNQRFKAIYLGLATEDRGLFQVLDSLKYVKNQEIEVHFVGNVSHHEYEGSIARQPGAVFHGRVPWQQVSEILADADVGLLLFQPTPAHLHFTGEGNTKLFEYMSAGLPIVFSDLTQLKRLLTKLDVGIPVDPTDPKAIAEALDCLYDNITLRRRLSDNGKRAVAEQYNWENQEAQLLGIYGKLFGRPEIIAEVKS